MNEEKEKLTAEIEALEEQIDKKEKRLYEIRKIEDKEKLENLVGKYFAVENVDEYYKVLDMVSFVGGGRLRVLTLFVPNSVPFSGHISTGHTIIQEWIEITEEEFNEKRDKLLKQFAKT